MGNRRVKPNTKKYNSVVVLALNFNYKYFQYEVFTLWNRVIFSHFEAELKQRLTLKMQQFTTQWLSVNGNDKKYLVVNHSMPPEIISVIQTDAITAFNQVSGVSLIQHNIYSDH